MRTNLPMRIDDLIRENKVQGDRALHLENELSTLKIIINDKLTETNNMSLVNLISRTK